jgi:hypothetical protein
MKLNSVDGCGTTITLPPNVNEIAVYVSKGNDRERYKYVNKLYLWTLKVTRLDLL